MDYETLLTEKTELIADYSNLQSNFQTLTNQHNQLVADYSDASQPLIHYQGLMKT